MVRQSARKGEQSIEQYAEITRSLVSLVERDPELEFLLERSIEKAATVNGDPETNPVRSLSEYYDVVDETYKLIPQHILETPAELTREWLRHSLCYFYFLIDQELPELAGRDLHRPTVQYYEPLADWLSEFAREWGAFLDTEESWNDEVYQQFRADPRFNLDRGWYESPANWETFNDFFARELRTPDARPIVEGESVVASPVDSVPMGTWEIDEESRLSTGLTAKTCEYHDVRELLGEESDYADAFAGGTFSHAFLGLTDYHHYHSPVGGTVVEMDTIRDHVALDVGWDAEKGRYDPILSVGWQFCQTRGYVLVDTDEYGLVACIPIGMSHVSSITFEDDVEPGRTVEKGDRLGTFYFGGSDFVLLFEEQAEFELTVPTDDSPSVEEKPRHEHVKMGEQYGVFGS